jgi:hypothetical protein
MFKFNNGMLENPSMMGAVDDTPRPRACPLRERKLPAFSGWTNAESERRPGRDRPNANPGRPQAPSARNPRAAGGRDLDRGRKALLQRTVAKVEARCAERDRFRQEERLNGIYKSGKRINGTPGHRWV